MRLIRRCYWLALVLLLPCWAHAQTVETDADQAPPADSAAVQAAEAASAATLTEAAAADDDTTPADSEQSSIEENDQNNAAQDQRSPAAQDEQAALDEPAAGSAVDQPVNAAEAESTAVEAPLSAQVELPSAETAADAAAAPADSATATAEGSLDLDPNAPSPSVDASAAEPATSSSSFGLLDQNRLNAFLDGVVEASMLQYHLPGVVVAVVEADQLISSRGWGFADLEKRSVASPSNSLFRVGSVSKVVTATALMQLVERGQADLDQPIGRYLDPVPFSDAEAVTLKHLLNHQGGFEDGYLGHFVADDESSDYTLEDYIARFPPARVRNAGELSSYSNYSWAVLGQVVATVSGSPFEDYMDNQLLGPLGMRQSSFREAHSAMPTRSDALPAALADQRAQGYRYSGGLQQPNERWWLHRGMAPAGSLSATAEDMARFMRMHLNDGLIDGVQVLRGDTITQMHSEISRHHEVVGGNAHGFWSNQISGLKTLEHGGAIFNFYSNLVLIPEAKVGIFVSTNGGEGRQFTQDLPRLIVEQFLASRAPVNPMPAGFADRAQALTGVYRTTRRNYSKLEASGTLFDADTTVSLVDDSLLISGSGPAQSYTEVEPGVFRSDRDGRRIAFSSTADGPAKRLYPNYGHVVLERVPWYARSELFWGVFGTLLVLSVLRVLGLRLRKPQPAGPASHSAAVVAYLAALGWIAFSIGLMMVFTDTAKPESPLIVHFPNQLAIWSLGIGLGAAALSLLCLVLMPSVLRGQWPWWRRWHFALFTLAAVLSLPLLWYWRLLGYHLYGTTNVLLPPLIGG